MRLLRQASCRRLSPRRRDYVFRAVALATGMALDLLVSVFQTNYDVDAFQFFHLG
jgi:hypothetical protein